MANSKTSDVSAGDITLASQYNNARIDIFGLTGVAVTLAYTKGLPTSVVLLGVTYTLTFNFRREVATISDGTNTLTINRNSQGFITSLS